MFGIQFALGICVYFVFDSWLHKKLKRPTNPVHPGTETKSIFGAAAEFQAHGVLQETEEAFFRLRFFRDDTFAFIVTQQAEE